MAQDTESDLGTLVVCNACFCCLESCYCKFPECCGCVEKVNCLCCECFESCGLIEPRCILCAGQTQCCCHDYRYSCPCSDAVPCACTLLPFCLICPKCQCCATLADINPGISNELNVDPTAVTVCSALCCCIQGCYCKCPDCLGCAAFCVQLCCCRSECYQKITCENITCCKCVGHCCCFDSRCAVPCDEEVPVACTLCPFLVVVPCDKVGCCKTIQDLGYTPPPYATSVVVVRAQPAPITQQPERAP
mmetsp:Transcript_7231/g.22050  ORF Transcript_7231/g.22050 Transcript_7231/m.22050 type:complete len:248 (+) Transcript_7231:53-796(+)